MDHGMYRYILLPVVLVLFLATSAQNPRDILRGSYAKCLGIQSGTYHGVFQDKYLMTTDTVHGAAGSIFERSPHDTVCAWKFHNRSYFQGRYMGDILYTGDCLVHFNALDSVGQSTSRERYPGHIKQLFGGAVIYGPFDPRHNSPFPADSVYGDTADVFDFLGYERVGCYDCYHIRLTESVPTTMSHQMERLKKVTDFWLNKLDSIPVQYTTFEKYVYKGDTTDEFRKQTLDAYQLNHLMDTVQLTLASIPVYCRLNEYAPEKPRELLPAGTDAPDWALRSTDNREIRLHDLKGHPILIDFFYKSCLPCIDALPVIEGLNEKYNTRGLLVMGLDSFDKNGKSLTDFLKDRNIRYPVMLDGAVTNDAYHVTRYPTLYLLDKEGRVLFSQVGVGADDEKKLDELIRQNL